MGDLFSITPEDTPLLSAIGGLTGGKPTSDVQFEWQFYDLRDADETRQRVEGDDAPDPMERVRQNASNVVEIHQEAVSVSYTEKAVAQGNFDTTARGSSPVADELRWQMDQQIKQVARDVNKGFLVGTYAKPATNASPRKTRGLLQAITSNVFDGQSAFGGGPIQDIEDFNSVIQVVYQNGGIREGETRTFLVGPALKRFLTKIFLTDLGLQPLSRNVGGVSLDTVQTDFGTFNVILDRLMPVGECLILSMEELAPRFLTIPGKGHFFWEPLAKVGARDESQLYGEIGLEYGNEKKHARIYDLTTPYDNVGVSSGSGSGS